MGGEPIKLGYARVITTSEKALNVMTKEHGTFWIPKKAVHDDSEVWDAKNNNGELVVKSWFAERKGLV